MLSNAVQELLGQAQKQEGKQPNNRVEVALDNAEHRLQSLYDNAFPQYIKNPKAFLERSGALWFIRKDLEAARFYLTGGLEGHGNQEHAVRDLELFNHSKYWELKALLAVTEGKVAEIEKAKGYGFAMVQDNKLIYKKLNTDILLSPSESSEI